MALLIALDTFPVQIHKKQKEEKVIVIEDKALQRFKELVSLCTTKFWGAGIVSNAHFALGWLRYRICGISRNFVHWGHILCIFYFNFNIMKSEPNLPPDLFPVKGLQEADEHVIFHASWGKNLSCILKKNKSSEEEKSLSCIHQFFCILGIQFSDFCLVSHSDKKLVG